MSNIAKNAATVKVEEKVVAEVPAQKAGETKDVAVDPRVAAGLVIDDALKAIEEGRLSEGVTLSVTIDKDGEVNVEISEPGDSKFKKIAEGTTAIFKRNKKLVIVSAGLIVASAVLKVIARRQAELEADEVVESSDEVNTDA